MLMIRREWLSGKFWNPFTGTAPEGRAPDGGEDETTFRYSLEEDDQPLVAIVEAVAWIKGVDFRDLEPLYRVIDVEELRKHMNREPSQFNPARSDSDHGDPEVTFRYEGCEVTVDRDTIRVRLE